MKVELIACTPDCQKVIEVAARTCYDSFDKTTDDSFKKIIHHLIKSGHLSVLEHASATFLISDVSRALTHQLVRHRIASFSQKSQRYVKETEPSYVTPPSISSTILDSGADVIDVYNACMKSVWHVYNFLLQKGIPPEDARFVLPNSACSSIVMSMNFRELRHYLDLRLKNKTGKAQWEIQQMSKLILEELLKVAPDVFADYK